MTLCKDSEDANSLQCHDDNSHDPTEEPFAMLSGSLILTSPLEDLVKQCWVDIEIIETF